LRYEGAIYRPPSEADSLLIQATIGCPHNKCTFCAIYKQTTFRIRPVEEIKKDLIDARKVYGEGVWSVFFPDGNTIAMKTSDLCEILTLTGTLFPLLERITMYGSAKFINRKSVEELKALKEAGLKRIHCGMESGDNEVLGEIKKGVTAREIIESGLKVKEAGIELSEYVLMGIGGPELSTRHALESARVLNEIDPDFIRIRTFIPRPGSPLFERCQNGEFKVLSPHEVLRELEQLIRNLELDSEILSDHVSNYWDVRGKMPEDKGRMLKEISFALAIEEDLLEKGRYGGI